MLIKCERYNFMNNCNKLFKFSLLWTNLILLTLLIDSCIGHDFGYFPEEQKFWANRSKTCNGKKQSPIPINKKNVIKIKGTPKLKWLNYRSYLPGPLSIQNNGHTVTFNLPKRGKRPTISGSKLPGVFELHSFHFHWGKINSRGSEHVISGKRYPLELHMVHTNVKYSKSLDESMKHNDGLVVIAILYKVSISKHTPLESIIKYVNNVIDAGNVKILESPKFSMASLFRTVNTKSYYLYKGSLTTPPCSEAVTWLIFPSPAPEVTNKELNIFRKLKQKNGEQMYDNYRNLQKLNDRIIYYSTKR